MYEKNTTDKDWEFFAREDPYWAAITHDRFRKNNFDDFAKIDFFDSGEKYIDWVFQKIYLHFDKNYLPQKALDFGCGVGRLILPLARRVSFVVGVDVSEFMLEEAKKNINNNNINHISLVKSDDQLSKLIGKFDFINSFIVFQHIPIDRGYKILSSLIEHLEDGGIGVIHFTYSKSVVNLTKTKKLSITYFIRIAKKLFRVLTRRATPIMQMNSYSLNLIFKILQEAGVHQIYVDFTDHGGNYGTVLFFQKPA